MRTKRRQKNICILMQIFYKSVVFIGTNACVGAASRTRTEDLHFTKVLLYQLS